LALLDRALHARGHRVDCVGSRRRLCAGAWARPLAKWSVDLDHMHGLDFCEYPPPEGVTTLGTLHLPAEFYRPRT
jgi:hypothetical protein